MPELLVHLSVDGNGASVWDGTWGHAGYDQAVLPALILAAGASRRMGFPKALLQTPEGRLFVAHLVRTLNEVGLENIGIVTGVHHDAIVDAVTADDPVVLPRFIRNPAPDRGQLSSVWVGMDALLEPASEGLLITLVDVPLVSASTVVKVVDAWTRTRAPITRPAMGPRHGHPVIFDRVVFDELRRAPIDQGAKVVVRAHEHDLLNVPVADEGCLLDVDTPQDYEALKRT